MVTNPVTANPLRRWVWFGRVGVLGLVVGSLLVAGLWCLGTQGTSLVVGPVTEGEVVTLKLNHYFTPDRQAYEPDFEWTFTETDFVLKRAQGPIPADLLEHLLPPDTTADEIRGKWKLGENGHQLLLTGLKAGEKGGREAVPLLIYKTASAVVRIGEPQYVFSVGR